MGRCPRGGKAGLYRSHLSRPGIALGPLHSPLTDEGVRWRGGRCSDTPVQKGSPAGQGEQSAGSLHLQRPWDPL